MFRLHLLLLVVQLLHGVFVVLAVYSTPKRGSRVVKDNKDDARILREGVEGVDDVVIESGRNKHDDTDTLACGGTLLKNKFSDIIPTGTGDGGGMTTIDTTGRGAGTGGGVASTINNGVGSSDPLRTKTNDSTVKNLLQMRQNLPLVKHDVGVNTEPDQTSSKSSTMSRDDLTMLRDDLMMSRSIATMLRDDLTMSRDDLTMLRDDLMMLRDDVAMLRDDITMSRSDARMLRDDVAMFRDDVTMLRDDVAMFGNDVTVLRVDAAMLKYDVAMLRDDVPRQVRGFSSTKFVSSTSSK